jgi:hypothetical protein
MGPGRVGDLANPCDPQGVMRAPVTPTPWCLLSVGPSGAMKAAQRGLAVMGFLSGGRGSTTIAGGIGEARKGAAVPGRQRSLVNSQSETGASL